MAGDEERREIAARLRGPFDVIGQGRYVSLNGTLFGMQLLASSENKLRWGVRRLADLIEPPTQCPHYHSDRHYCSVHEDVREIDRDALLALADEMDDIGIGCVILRDGARNTARRIREALGVER